MATTLSNLKNSLRKTKIRLGRGNSSGHGNYSGKGSKGQRARSGGRKGLRLKGYKRMLLNLPKFKGMKSHQPATQIIKLSQIEKFFKDAESVNLTTLLAKRLINSADQPVKVLADRKEIKVKVEINGCTISESARAVIEKAGGKVA